MRADDIRTEVLRLIRAAPFEPFVLNLENGDRVTVAHPENIAFDPDGGTAYYVISGPLRLAGSFAAVTSVGTRETAEALGRAA